MYVSHEDFRGFIYGDYTRKRHFIDLINKLQVYYLKIVVKIT